MRIHHTTEYDYITMRSQYSNWIEFNWTQYIHWQHGTIQQTYSRYSKRKQKIKYIFLVMKNDVHVPISQLRPALSVTDHEPHSARGPSNLNIFQVQRPISNIRGHWKYKCEPKIHIAEIQIARTPEFKAAEGSGIKHWKLNKIPDIYDRNETMK